MWMKLDRAMKACPVDKSKYLVNFMGFYKFRDTMPKEVYGKGALYPFEDGQFNKNFFPYAGSVITSSLIMLSDIQRKESAEE